MSNAQPGDGTLRTILIVLAIIILFPLLMMVFAFPLMGMMGWWGGGYGPMMGGYGAYGGSAISPLWGIGMMLVFLAVLVAIGYFLYRGLVRGRHVGGRSDAALEELRLAYARGDISHEEYDERMARLQSHMDEQME